MIKLPARGRALLGVVIYIPVLMVLGYPFTLLDNAVRNIFKFNHISSYIVSVIINLAATLLGTYLIVRFWDRKPFSEFGLTFVRKTVKLLVVGILMGGLLISVYFATAIGARWIAVKHIGPVRGSSSSIVQMTEDQLKRLPADKAKALKIQKEDEDRAAHSTLDLIAGLLANIVILLTAAVNEEVIFRGYFLKNLARGLGILPAVIISSLIFGFLHILHGPFTASNLLFGFNVALVGVLFALAFLLAKSLWLPVAIHFAWNYFQGPIYGFAISGAHQTPELLQLTIKGPEILTGGGWGPEGSLVITAILIVVLAAAFSLTEVRKRAFLWKDRNNENQAGQGHQCV